MLRLDWVDRIFEKLTLAYGQQFLARWRDLDLDAVKHDWATELDGFEDHPAAIAFGLANLDPEKPPTALAFSAICRRAPMPNVPALPPPPADPERLKLVLAKLAPVRAALASGGIDHKAWARRILDRDRAGDRINPASLRFAQEALRPSIPTPMPAE